MNSNLPPPLPPDQLPVSLGLPRDASLPLEAYRPRAYPRAFGRLPRSQTPTQKAAIAAQRRLNAQLMAAAIPADKRREWGSRGGRAAQAKLSPEQRREKALKARSAQLSKNPPNPSPKNADGSTPSAELSTPRKPYHFSTRSREELSAMSAQATAARLANSTPEQRREASRKAALQRWVGHVPKRPLPKPPMSYAERQASYAERRTRLLATTTPAERSARLREVARARWAKVRAAQITAAPRELNPVPRELNPVPSKTII